MEELFVVISIDRETGALTFSSELMQAPLDKKEAEEMRQFLENAMGAYRVYLVMPFYEAILLKQADWDDTSRKNSKFIN